MVWYYAKLLTKVLNIKRRCPGIHNGASLFLRDKFKCLVEGFMQERVNSEYKGLKLWRTLSHGLTANFQKCPLRSAKPHPNTPACHSIAMILYLYIEF